MKFSRGARVVGAAVALAVGAAVAITATPATAGPTPPRTIDSPRPGGTERRRAGLPAGPAFLHASGKDKFVQQHVISSGSAQYVPYRPHLRRPARRRRRLRRRHQQRRSGPVQFGRAVRVRSATCRSTPAITAQPRRRSRRHSCKHRLQGRADHARGARARRRRARLAWESTVDGIGADGISRLSVYVDARTGKVLGTQEHVTEGTGSSAYSGTGHARHDPVGQHLHHEGPGHHEPQLPGRGEQHDVQRPGRLVGQRQRHQPGDRLRGRAVHRADRGQDAVAVARPQRHERHRRRLADPGRPERRERLLRRHPGAGRPQHRRASGSARSTWSATRWATASTTTRRAASPAATPRSSSRTRSARRPSGSPTSRPRSTRRTSPSARRSTWSAAARSGTCTTRPSSATTTATPAASRREEVHAAAGPGNHWFYLLAEGTSPTNGQPTSPTCNSTSVTGLGIQTAMKIMYNAMLMKTTSQLVPEVPHLDAAGGQEPVPEQLHRVQHGQGRVERGQRAGPDRRPDLHRGRRAGARPTRATRPAPSASPPASRSSASGGTTPYTFSATGLPAGLSINASSGVISGTPTTAGTSTVTATVTDSASPTHATPATFTWTIVTGRFVRQPRSEDRQHRLRVRHHAVDGDRRRARQHLRPDGARRHQVRLAGRLRHHAHRHAVPVGDAAVRLLAATA